MTEKREEEAVLRKLEDMKAGPVLFTEEEARVTRALARTLLHVPRIFGSFKQIVVFATIIATAVVAFSNAFPVIVGWLAAMAGGGGS